MNTSKPTFYIGYDSKEDIAYRVCKYSLQKRSSVKLNIYSSDDQHLPENILKLKNEILDFKSI